MGEDRPLGGFEPGAKAFQGKVRFRVEGHAKPIVPSRRLPNPDGALPLDG